jgi:hypothetical protein
MAATSCCACGRSCSIASSGFRWRRSAACWTRRISTGPRRCARTAPAWRRPPGVTADSAPAQGLVRRLHHWVGVWWGAEPGKDRFLGLAGLYAEHPQFSGLTDYLVAAMQAYATSH